MVFVCEAHLSAVRLVDGAFNSIEKTETELLAPGISSGVHNRLPITNGIGGCFTLQIYRRLVVGMCEVFLEELINALARALRSGNKTWIISRCPWHDSATV